MLAAVSVALGGAAGAVCRWLAGQVWPETSSWPVTTLSVNLLGAFLAGLAAEALLPRLPSWAAAGIKTGFLGGLTTFSAIVLAQSQQEPAHAVLYALLSVVLGLASAGAGVVLGRKVRAA